MLNTLSIGSSILNNMAGAGSSVYNAIQSRKQNMFNNMMTLRNYNLQLAQMHREDNAIQRRVSDLTSAGLSPTLAAGSAAATGNYAVSSNTSPASADAPNLDVSQSLLNYMGLKKLDAEIAVSNEQRKLLEKQQDKIDSQTTGQQYDNRIKKVQSENVEATGFVPNTTVGGAVQDITGAVNHSIGNQNPHGLLDSAVQTGSKLVNGIKAAGASIKNKAVETYNNSPALQAIGGAANRFWNWIRN